MTIILIFFGMSYLLRVAYDLLIESPIAIKLTTFTIYYFRVVSCIPFDILPIFVVLLFHRRNLRQINTKQVSFEEEENYETTNMSETDFQNY